MSDLLEAMKKIKFGDIGGSFDGIKVSGATIIFLFSGGDIGYLQARFNDAIERVAKKHNLIAP